MRKWYEEKKNKDMLFFGALALMAISPFLESFGIITSMLAVFIAFYSTDDEDDS